MIKFTQSLHELQVAKVALLKPVYCILNLKYFLESFFVFWFFFAVFVETCDSMKLLLESLLYQKLILVI